MVGWVGVVGGAGLVRLGGGDETGDGGTGDGGTGDGGWARSSTESAGKCVRSKQIHET